MQAYSWRWLVLGCLAVSLICGCQSAPRGRLARQTGGNAALFQQFRAYDGRSGRAITFAQVVDRCRSADVVFFGEQHSDPVCNQLEAQLFAELANIRRPVALAMEFFEADTQAALDAYLTGKLDEQEFRELARQKRAYVLAHRPLIELCRAARVPVIAANAPRELVSEYRKSGLLYPDYRTSLPPEQLRWLPRESAYLTGGYEERFMAIMQGAHEEMVEAPAVEDAPDEAVEVAETAEDETAERIPAAVDPHAPPPPSHEAPDEAQPIEPPPQQHGRPMNMHEAPPGPLPHGRGSDQTPHTHAHSGEEDPLVAMYRAQLLWDDAMAESVATFRERFPRRQVMLIVGVFHVAEDGGTVAKYRLRRPEDRICTIIYQGTEDPALPLDPENIGAGDIILCGIQPPPKPPEAIKPMPEHPKTPEEAAETQPAGDEADEAVDEMGEPDAGEGVHPPAGLDEPVEPDGPPAEHPHHPPAHPPHGR